MDKIQLVAIIYGVICFLISILKLLWNSNRSEFAYLCGYTLGSLSIGVLNCLVVFWGLRLLKWILI